MRWLPRRKAAVLAAIDDGALSAAQAQQLYELSREELDSWRRDFAAHGVPGLRLTRLQAYREPKR